MACPGNLGPRERAKRLWTGVAMLVVGVGAAAALIVLQQPAAVRIPLLAPFWLGINGLLQARSQT
jgi:hypothetical protein